MRGIVIILMELRPRIWLLIFSLIFSSCSKGKDSGRSTNDPPASNDNGGQNNGVAKKDSFQADPTIFEEDGTFYLYGTNDENPNTGFQVYTSQDLKKWEGPKGYRNGYALSEIENYGDSGFWAPQVWKYKDNYYMAYTANEHIAVSTRSSPTGPFFQSTQKALFTGTQKQIDPFVFQDEDGKKYLFYVDISNDNKIFMTGLNDGFMSVKNETGLECIRSTEAWENNGQPSAKVTEGPTVIKHLDYYYLLYSANHFKNPNYAVGYATSKSIDGPWEKYNGNPILSRDKIKWSGTGHGDLILKKDGSVFLDQKGNMYYVFHTHFSEDGAMTVPRKTAIVKMRFIQVGSGADVLEIKTDSFEHLMVN